MIIIRAKNHYHHYLNLRLRRRCHRYHYHHHDLSPSFKGNAMKSSKKNKLGTSGCILTALLCIFTAQQWAICTMSNMSKITVESLIVQANEHLPKRGCRKLEMYACCCCCCCCCFRSVGFVSFKAVWTENLSEANRPYQTLSRVLLRNNNNKKNAHSFYATARTERGQVYFHLLLAAKQPNILPWSFRGKISLGHMTSTPNPFPESHLTTGTCGWSERATEGSGGWGDRVAVGN